MKSIYIIVLSFFVVHQSVADDQSRSEKMATPYCDNSFKLIKEIAGKNHGQKWMVKAYESPDEINIYIHNVYGLFDPQKQLRSCGDQLSFRISCEGKGIQVVHDKEKNPKHGGYGPAGGFNLPLPVAKELWSTIDNVHFIDPVKISQDEILLVMPKYKNGSFFSNWFSRRKFGVWTMSLD
jgi:hypothetical protein